MCEDRDPVSWMCEIGRDFDRPFCDWIVDIFKRGLRLAVETLSGYDLASLKFIPMIIWLAFILGNYASVK